MTKTDHVLVEVAEERCRQVEEWGPTHDDHHTPEEWSKLICAYADWANVKSGQNKPSEERKLMIQVAAIAVAAVEALDRAFEPRT